MDPSCLQKLRAHFLLDLHPSKLSDVRQGVRDLLNEQLLKYSDEFDGVLLSYGNVRIGSPKAKVHPYFPLCHLSVTADVVIFKATVGSTLVGRVIKIGADFIGLLVMGVFNASIPRDAMRPDFQCNIQAQEWRCTKHPKHSIQINSYVKFTVTKVQTQEAFFGIFGSLEKKTTGAMDYLGLSTASVPDSPEAAAAAAAETPALKSSSKHKRSREEVAAAGEGEQTAKKKKKKDKAEQQHGAEACGPRANGAAGAGNALAAAASAPATPATGLSKAERKAAKKAAQQSAVQQQQQQQPEDSSSDDIDEDVEHARSNGKHLKSSSKKPKTPAPAAAEGGSKNKGTDAAEKKKKKKKDKS